MNKKKLNIFILHFLISISLAFPQINESNQNTKEKSQTPKEDNSIIFGQSASFSGALRYYGHTIKNIIEAAFAEQNDKGGILGRKLKLISKDDKGKAFLAAKNIRDLHKKGINLFIGCMNTRGILKILPLIKAGNIAMLFPWGGDEKLRDPSLKFEINGLGLITPQTQKIIDYIVDELKLIKIAIYHSDGPFSKKAAQVAIKQLQEKGINPIEVAAYNRFTLNVKSRTKKLVASDPQAVISLATSYPTVKLINIFFENGLFGTRFFGIDSTFLVGQELRNKGVSFHYSSPVPSPIDPSIEIVKKYQECLKKYLPKEQFNILSLAYYIQTKIIIQALLQSTENGLVTKEKLIEQLEKMQNYNLDGFQINFNPQNRHLLGEKNIHILKG